MDADCATCHGERQPIYRCPNSHSTPEIADAFHALDWMESGLLPVQGGLLDQSSSFVAFVSIVATERAAIDRENKQFGETLKESMERGRT